MATKTDKKKKSTPRLTPSDKELVAQFRKGSMDAFQELIQRYETKAFNLAMSLTRNVEDAEEVLQDVFLTVYRKIDGFQGKSAFSSWLYRITVNAAFMKLRKRKQNQTIAVEEISPALESNWIEKSDRAHIGSDMLAINNELRTVLNSAISRLPEEYRTVFMLRDVDGLSNKEVGEILDLSIPAVKSRLHRSRLMLRKKLQRFYDDFVSSNQVLATGPKYLHGVANG
ncbi:MAG: sigma-70 family RNA polymerase sigma factor [Bdellovibrionales bacterium]|nr:sigma-70 family RNA polymerase sigma factor [Bdellovibrionales bacterium]